MTGRSVRVGAVPERVAGHSLLVWAGGNPYRFTVKPMALLLPDAVATATFTAPYLAFGGTLHLICASL